MARRHHHHEEHQNHEAWAVPYGDLVTLLLAFFVVMYAISSINEGKYRAVSDALSSAFGGPPRSINPIQLGETQLRGSSFDRPSLLTPGAKAGPTATSPVSNVRVRQMLDAPLGGRESQMRQQAMAKAAMDASLRGESQLSTLGRRIQHALAELVREKLVTVRRGPTFLEVEIQSDILFASGVAEPSPVATATVRKLGAVLREEPNAVRVEGYTDDVPIRTAAYPTNWELSSARAASVVHVLIGEGVDPGRLAVVGYGEHQPAADNATAEGRNANRRVLLVILAASQAVDDLDAVPAAQVVQAGIDGSPRVEAVDAARVETPALPAPATRATTTAAPDAHAGAH
jgi:chemotaxis protein MotB